MRKNVGLLRFAQNIKKVHSGCRRRFKRDLCVTQSRSHWPRLPVPACNSPLHEYSTCPMEWAERAPLSPGDPTQGFDMSSLPHTQVFAWLGKLLSRTEPRFRGFGRRRRRRRRMFRWLAGVKFATPFSSWMPVI